MSGRRHPAANGGARKVSRRRFIALLAASAGGGLPARGRAAPVPKESTTTEPTRSPEIEKGIAEQKTLLAQQLKAIRDFPLAAGSDPAFVFAPLQARKRRGTAGRNHPDTGR